MLEHFPGYETRERDIIRDVTVCNFGARHFDVTRGTSGTFVKANWAEATHVKVITAFCGMDTSTSYGELTAVRQFFEIGKPGRLEFDIGTKSTSLSRSVPSIIIPSSVAYGVKGYAKQNYVSLRIDGEALKNTMRALLDDDVPREITFDTQVGNTPWYQNLRQAVFQYMADLDLMGPDAAIAARDALAQSLMVKFLFCNFNALTGKLEAPALAPSIAQLRRIEDFIEANWHRSVDVEELSRLFNISTRSIFRHFKAYRGVSPHEYVKGVRLRKARKMLESDYKNRGVVAIAMMCGFQSLGHFSRDYREAFLELPSDTLRRSRSSTRPND